MTVLNEFNARRFGCSAFFRLKKKNKAKKHIYIYIYIYIYIVEGKRQINYKFIPTDLFRGYPLIRGFNENNLYHRLRRI